MSAPDLDEILAESPIHLHGKRLGAELSGAFSVADHRFFRAIAQWEALAPVLAGEVGDARATTEALIGLGEGRTASRFRRPLFRRRKLHQQICRPGRRQIHSAQAASRLRHRRACGDRSGGRL